MDTELQSAENQLEKISDRLLILRRSLYLTQRALADKVGFARAYISEIETGGKNVSKSTIYAYVENLNVNKEWLETGKGEMFNKTKEEKLVSNATSIGQIFQPENESPYVDLGNGQFLMIVPLIPIKASAGYRENFQDENYISAHYDKHYFPVTKQYRGKYFAFVVDGSSMDDGTSEAIIEASTVTGREIQKKHWVNKFHLNSFRDYVIVHRDVILVKRIIEHNTEQGTILCNSLNPDKKKYPDFELNLDECLQILNIVNVTQPR